MYIQAGLQPRDSVEVLYEIQEVGVAGGGASLTRVIQEHKDYIQTTTKGPVTPRTLDSDLPQKLIEDEQKVCHMTSRGCQWIVVCMM